MTVWVESIDGDTKREMLLWTTPIICKIKAMDWSQSKKELCHLRDLRIAKPVGSGEVDFLIGSDYYEEFLLPLEHRVGNPGEPVGVKTPLGLFVGHVPEEISCPTTPLHFIPTPLLSYKLMD